MSNGTGLAVVDRDGVMTDMSFDYDNYLANISGSVAVQRQKALAAAYDAACLALIGPNDVQKEGGREFKKKSAWRKLARHFNISTSILAIERGMVAEHFIATVTVRALAPWGQYADAVGACCTDEATGRRVITVADAIATAETRATNRATSNLIAMGEVTAEEMNKGGGGAKSAAEKKMPFGDDKGKPLGDIETYSLEKTLAWCRSDAAKSEKFKDLIAAIKEVIAARSADDEPDYSDAEMPV